MKVKIGIDIDNVLAESYPAYLDKFNSRFDAEVKLEQIREFYFLNRYIEENSIKHGKEMVDFIDEMVFDEKFQLEIPPIEEAINVINNWVKKGYDIHYVTSRPVEIRKITIDWLKKHGFWVEKAKVDLFDSEKRYQSDVPYKKEIANKYRINVFIEDAIEIALGMEIPVFLFDRPWNQGKLTKNIIRVYSWQEIEKKMTTVLGDFGDKNFECGLQE